MFGWRGRIGVVLPVDNTVLEPEFYRVLPEGVTAHMLRLTTADRGRMPVMAVEMAPAFAEIKANLVAYMCAASSCLLGPDGNERLAADLSRACGGIPAFTVSIAVAGALNALGVRRVAVLSPHEGPIAKKLCDYLEAAGCTVADMNYLNRTLIEINDTTPGEIYRAVRRLKVAGAGAVFIAATNFRATELISQLEIDLGIPVVTSNQAGLWQALRVLGVRSNIRGWGRLLQAESPSGGR